MDDKTSFALSAGAAAFGDGTHPSTRLAALALKGIAGSKHKIDSVLDMGCGSAVLTLLAAHFWPEARLVGADNEQSAVDAARENCIVNGIDATIVHAQNFQDRAIMQQAPYALVVANILPEILQKLASGMDAVVQPGGLVVLSGILQYRRHEMLEIYEAAGFVPVIPALCEGEWCALLLHREAE